MVQYTWLESIYQQLPEDVDEEVVEQHAYPQNDRRIPYARYIRVPSPPDLGSAVLACLYRGLCRAAVFKDKKEVGM
ncbi:hypothetical protein Lal_00022196 [Lupinus albus]|nr:hypothetical protein Lal_00022196 [Lupinus albus]